ncbi:MAG: hypothetical protein IPK13_03830 [Deltaproteobacteria bacterium]|nr:hypothetical protein [Deltaproteobacteria bacterium]
MRASPANRAVRTGASARSGASRQTGHSLLGGRSRACDAELEIGTSARPNPGAEFAPRDSTVPRARTGTDAGVRTDVRATMSVWLSRVLGEVPVGARTAIQHVTRASAVATMTFMFGHASAMGLSVDRVSGTRTTTEVCREVPTQSSRLEDRMHPGLTPSACHVRRDLDALSRSPTERPSTTGRRAAIESLRARPLEEVWARRAEAKHGHLYARAAVDDHYQDVSFPRGLRLDGDAPLTPDGISGTAYLTGGLGVIEGLEVVVRPTDHPIQGRGLSARFSVTPSAGDRLESRLAKEPATNLVDRSRFFAQPTERGVRLIESVDELRAAQLPTQVSSLRLGVAVRFEEPGRFRVDYSPHEVASRALWGDVEILAWGESEAAWKRNLRDALEFLGLASALTRGPTPEEESLQLKLSLLENADPYARLAFQKDYESGSLSSRDLDAALRWARVPKAFVDDAKFARIAGSHIAAVTPAQSEAYARHGVQGLHHLVYRLDDLPKIVASGGLLSTLQRLRGGLVSSGMSSAQDIDTGGAISVFTRAHLGGKGPYFSPGQVVIYIKPDALDRLDLYGYATDQFGSTSRGPPPEISRPLLELAKRVLSCSLGREGQSRTTSDMRSRSNSSWSSRSSSRSSSSSSSTLRDQPTDEVAARYLLSLARSADAFEGANLNRPVGAELIRQIVARGYNRSDYSQTNELMFGAIVPVHDMAAFIVASEADRQSLISGLHAIGLNNINGEPLESFIKLWEEIPEAPNWTPSDDAKTKREPLDFFVDRSLFPSPHTLLRLGARHQVVNELVDVRRCHV